MYVQFSFYYGLQSLSLSATTEKSTTLQEHQLYMQDLAYIPNTNWDEATILNRYQSINKYATSR